MGKLAVCSCFSPPSSVLYWDDGGGVSPEGVPCMEINRLWIILMSIMRSGLASLTERKAHDDSQALESGDFTTMYLYPRRLYLHGLEVGVTEAPVYHVYFSEKDKPPLR